MAIFDETWNPNFLIERLMELDETIRLIKQFIAENPNDEGLVHDLRNHEVHRISLVNCLQRSLVQQRQHAVSYIFKDASPGSIGLDTLIAGLQSFGSLVTGTFKELCGSKMELQFNATFAGSFGVLLSTPFDGYLLQSDFERGLTAVFDTIEKIGVEGTDTKELLKKNLKGNRDLIRKFTNFFSGIVKTGSPVEIRWQGIDGKEPMCTFVPVERAQKLHNLFAEQAKREPETIEMNGLIKGISLLRNTIDIQHQVQGKKKPKTLINIPFSPKLTNMVKAAFDVTATFHIQIDYDYNDLTGLEVQHRSLVNVAISEGT